MTAGGAPAWRNRPGMPSPGTPPKPWGAVPGRSPSLICSSYSCPTRIVKLFPPPSKLHWKSVATRLTTIAAGEVGVGVGVADGEGVGVVVGAGSVGVGVAAGVVRKPEVSN